LNGEIKKNSLKNLPKQKKTIKNKGGWNHKK
jgi:hypothetical protein